MHSRKSEAVLTKRELTEAAATYPLSEIDGDIGFEIHGFLSIKGSSPSETRHNSGGQVRPS